MLKLIIVYILFIMKQSSGYPLLETDGEPNNGEQMNVGGTPFFLKIVPPKFPPLSFEMLQLSPHHVMLIKDAEMNAKFIKQIGERIATLANIIRTGFPEFANDLKQITKLYDEMIPHSVNRPAFIGNNQQSKTTTEKKDEEDKQKKDAGNKLQNKEETKSDTTQEAQHSDSDEDVVIPKKQLIPEPPTSQSSPDAPPKLAAQSSKKDFGINAVPKARTQGGNPDLPHKLPASSSKTDYGPNALPKELPRRSYSRKPLDNQNALPTSETHKPDETEQLSPFQTGKSKDPPKQQSAPESSKNESNPEGSTKAERRIMNPAIFIAQERKRLEEENAAEEAREAERAKSKPPE